MSDGDPAFARPVRVIGVCGSLKRSSSNSALLRAMATAAAVRHQLDVWEQLGDLPHFSPDSDGGSAVAQLRDAIAASDVAWRRVAAALDTANHRPGP